MGKGLITIRKRMIMVFGCLICVSRINTMKNYNTYPQQIAERQSLMESPPADKEENELVLLSIPPNPQSIEEFNKWQQEILAQLPPTITASTYLVELRVQDIHIPEVFNVHDRILEGTPISENMRAVKIVLKQRIRSFLMSQGSKQWVMRDSITLACTYLDLFFCRKAQCLIKDLQLLAIACLILAQKMLDGKFPRVSFEVFKKEDLLNWERKVAKALNYRLSFPTYITIAENMVLRWDLYSKETKYASPVSEVQNQGPNWALRSLYEQLDCILMVLKSLSWSLKTLVANLLFLHLRKFNFRQVTESSTLDDQTFVRKFYGNDEFQWMFVNFLKEYDQFNKIELIPNLGIFLKPFTKIKPSQKSFPIKQSLDYLRVWEKLQTCNSESYNLCKSILQVRNANQM